MELTENIQFLYYYSGIIFSWFLFALFIFSIIDTIGKSLLKTYKIEKPILLDYLEYRHKQLEDNG